MISSDKLDKKINELLNVLYGKRLEALEKLKLIDLMNKNPYLYRSLGISQPDELIEQILIARISSSDETIFGNELFEPLALWAASESEHLPARTVTIGAGAGQDIAIEDEVSYIALSVKSGKNIFNSQSIKGQSTEFDALQARLKKSKKQFRAIIGYGYGRKRVKKASPTEKLAGQALWEVLTGEQDFYIRIEKSIGKFSIHHGEIYKEKFSFKMKNLINDFRENFVDCDGVIRWDSIVMFNSSESNPKRLLSCSQAGEENLTLNFLSENYN